MHILLLIAGLLSSGCGEALAQSAALGLYNEANALYRRGEFQAARDKYFQVTQAGVQDARLYYNLGNAYFKTEQLGEAILWYERALRHDPRDADIRANLRFANRVKKDRDPVSEENVVWRFLVKLYLFPTLNELSLALGLTLFMVVVLIARRLWSRERARALWMLLIISCSGLTVLVGIYLGARVYQQEHLVEAIVTAGEGIARYGPDEAQTVVFVVHEGTKVRVERREGDWLLVRLPNSLGGWLPAKAVTEI